MACGAESSPLRPTNSARSPLTPRSAASTSKNATRCGNSVLYALRATIAPLAGSISVITCMAVFARRSPITHSTYPVALSLRGRPDVLRTLSDEYFTVASIATYTHSRVSMPSSRCSKTL